MERILQYLDDLDDLYGMLGLVIERVRYAVARLLSLVALFAVAVTGAFIAVLNAPVALATVILLLVALLYRGVTTRVVRLSGATR